MAEPSGDTTHERMASGEIALGLAVPGSKQYSLSRRPDSNAEATMRLPSGSHRALV